MRSIELETLAAVRALAEAEAGSLPRGEFVGFSGELGTGKTTLIQELVRALGFHGEVLSPTYTLEHIYELSDGTQIHHWDLYRLKPDFEWQALEELCGSPDQIILIEWPERVPEIDSRVLTRFALAHSGAGRRLTITRKSV